MAGEKTEKATQKRKRDERKKGNVFQSNDAISAVSIILVFFVFKVLSPTFVKYTQELLVSYLSLPGVYEPQTIKHMQEISVMAIKDCVILALPMALTAMITGIVISGAQTRFIFSMDSVKPKFNKLNPLTGIKNMFSIRSAVELIKNLMKVTVIGIVVYNNISKIFMQLPKTISLDIPQSAKFIADSIWDIVINITIIYFFIAAADFGYQWWDYEKKLKMSKQEIKEEYKQMEGDPQIKGKIKEKQRAMAMNRMMQNVPSADVVIKNPTHFAVAIKYDPEKYNAPMVLAKGQDRVALKIIEIAEENGIITMENRPLARALYAGVEIGKEVPAEFYQSVAEVLAYVYNLNKKEL
ncbi:MAG: flagellar biosynthesis protein FlhB [Oscillospiraceae bacterium]